MSKLLSILLFLSLLIQSTSSLWVKVLFEINRDYIAENVCINRFERIPICRGACYLEKQLKEDNQKQDKLPDLKLKDVSFVAIVTPLLAYSLPSFFSIEVEYNQQQVCVIISNILSNVFRPPIVMV